MTGPSAGTDTTAPPPRLVEDWRQPPAHKVDALPASRLMVSSSADGAGHVQVLPCPAAAAIGLGLLDALGWHDIARQRLDAGQTLQPPKTSA